MISCAKFKVYNSFRLGFEKKLSNLSEYEMVIASLLVLPDEVSDMSMSRINCNNFIQFADQRELERHCRIGSCEFA